MTSETDVLVVGAGPGGSAAAYHLARHGVDVTLVDRARFPREKVCGDGLTPRGVRALTAMGVDPGDPGFQRIEGLRVHSEELSIEMPWPELETFPSYGLVRTRMDLDELLARRAVSAGARLLEETEARSPVMDGGWVAGANVSRNGDGEDAIRARFVIAADGAASRFAQQAGVRRDPGRPLGIAARRYYRVERDPGPWFVSWLDLWEGDIMLPGYGWLFPVPDGTINLGAGLLNTSRNFQNLSARRIFDAFAEMIRDEWGVSEETATGRSLSGPLPMGLNRRPQAVPGMLVVGDAAGAVNPFNGEGIAYAMESGELAAELVHDALVTGRPGVAHLYPAVLRERYGSYFGAGRTFVKLIGNPSLMRAFTRYGLPRPRLMRFLFKLMANLTDGRGGDVDDRIMDALLRVVPAT